MNIQQEIIDAPEPKPKPVAWRYEDAFGTHFTEDYSEISNIPGVLSFTALYTIQPAPPADVARDAEPVAKVLHVDGLLSNNLLDCDLPVGTLLYAAPPAPSVPDGMKLIPKVATPEMLVGLIGAGCCKSLEKAYAALYAAAQQPEPPADVARDAARYRWLRTHGLQRAWVSLGTDFEGDNFASFRCEFNLPEPPNLPYEDDEGLQWADKDFDAAIDAAIERELLGE